MKVHIAYADQKYQIWMSINVEDNSKVKDVILQSGVLETVPEIDIQQQKIGVFGKFTRLDANVNDGDRIEIYRPITRVLDEDDDEDDD